MAKKAKKPNSNPYKAPAQTQPQEKRIPDAAFKSKVDWWFLLLLALTAVLALAMVYDFLINGSQTIILALFLILVDVFMLIPMLANTHYTFQRIELWVRCGFFCNLHIPYSDITGYEESSGLLSPAALSSRRIKISYFQNGTPTSILISPKEQQAFFNEMERRLGW